MVFYLFKIGIAVVVLCRIIFLVLTWSTENLPNTYAFRSLYEPESDQIHT
jgi:hypothetical protein